MENITEQYPSYDQLVDSFGVETLHSDYLGDYQGDFVALLRDGDRYGYLVFGYGSCSGCDALEACYGDLPSLTELRDDMWSAVLWGTRGEIQKYFKDKDEKLEWWGHCSGYDGFKAKALELLRA